MPFYSLPRVPGLIDQEDGVKESFEIPPEHAERILTLFDRLSKDTLTTIPSLSKDVEACLLDKQEQSPTQNEPVQ